MKHSLGRLAGLLLLACVLVACSKQQPSEPLRTAADDTLAEHALKHTSPKYRCPMHPEVIRDEPGELGRLFVAAGDLDVNLEDVRIDHVLGKPSGLVELSVRPEVTARLVAGLRSLGFDVRA